MDAYAAAVTLILVMDPLGNIPVFLSILRKFDSRKQIRIILRESVIAFIILTAFLFFGKYIMQALHIGTVDISIAGGIILFLIAIRMIFPAEKRDIKDEHDEEPFIVPLAIPLTAGPSAIATVLLFVSREPGLVWNFFIAVVVATIFFLVVMLLARQLMHLLGNRALIAIERLMGMILAAISVQMFLSGLARYLTSLSVQ